MKTVKKIKSITIRHHYDENADTSYIGEFTDNLEPGVIVIEAEEFYEKLPDDFEIAPQGRNVRGFIPYAQGEKPGTKNFYKYGMQDFHRIQQLESGSIYFIGIDAEAETLVSFDGGKNWKIDHIASGGLWGIESDSDSKYLREVEQEELTQLKQLLKAYGFSTKQINFASRTLLTKNIMSRQE